MVWKRLCRYLQYAALACLAVCTLAATEHRGQVKFGGLPVPGATVTVTQGDKKFTAVTDDQGVYSFPNLADGIWTIQVEMLCFSPIQQEVAVTAGAPNAEWELKLLPFDQIKASAPPPARRPAAIHACDRGAAAAAAGTSTAAAPSGKPDKKAKGKNAAPRGSDQRRAGVSKSRPECIRRRRQTSGRQFQRRGHRRGQSRTAIQRRLPDQRQREQRRRFALRPIGGVRQQPPRLRSLYNGDLGVILDNSALDARPFRSPARTRPSRPTTTCRAWRPSAAR